MNNQTSTPQETFTIFEAIQAVHDNQALKFVTTLPIYPYRKLMIYSGTTARVWDFDESVLTVTDFSDNGVCMRSDDRFPDTVLVVDELTASLEYVPYEGSFTDFVNKTFFIIVEGNSTLKLSIKVDADVIAGLVEGSEFTDITGKDRFRVLDIETRERSEDGSYDPDEDDLSYDKVQGIWYHEEYEPYTETLYHIMVLEREANS